MLRLLLVTHNPATQGLALSLSATGDKALLRQMAEKYPTAALAVMSLAGNDWPSTKERTAKLDHFIRPRDLADG